jgi:hypothetical protein
MIKPKIRTKGKRGSSQRKQMQFTSKAPDICQTRVSVTIRSDCTECLRSPSTYSQYFNLILVVEDEEGLGVGIGRVPELDGERPQRGSSSSACMSASSAKLGHPTDASTMSLFGAAEVLGRSEASTISTSAFCFPLSNGGSSDVRSITVGVGLGPEVASRYPAP